MIPLSYLQELHDLHERWLMGDGENQGGTISKEIPAKVLVIDADQVKYFYINANKYLSDFSSNGLF